MPDVLLSEEKRTSTVVALMVATEEMEVTSDSSLITTLLHCFHSGIILIVGQIMDDMEKVNVGMGRKATH